MLANDYKTKRPPGCRVTIYDSYHTVPLINQPGFTPGGDIDTDIGKHALATLIIDIYIYIDVCVWVGG